MKVTIYSAKGGQGKTPIALNMAMHNEWALCTNEDTPDLDRHLEKDVRLIVAEPDQEFPSFPDDIEIVFDLGGMLRNSVESVRSAVEQSNVVVVPIRNDEKSKLGGIKTILEIAPINPNILVIANMLSGKGKDKTYETGKDYIQITDALKAAGLEEIPVLPLKRTSAFEEIYAFDCCIRDVVEGKHEDGTPFILPMVRHQYLEPIGQFETIMNYIRDNYEQ